MTPEGPSGLAVDAAHAIIGVHGTGGGCSACRPGWCPSQEWALWMVVGEKVPDAIRHLVTVVARLVMAAHWPRTVDGCRPCGSPDCDRMQVASAWLEVHDPGYVPPSVAILMPSAAPTDDDLRRITGMD
jgi:hypothetical protein